MCTISKSQTKMFIYSLNSQQNMRTFSCLFFPIFFSIPLLNTPVSSYDGVSIFFSVNEARKVFVYENGGTDAAWDA